MKVPKSLDNPLAKLYKTFMDRIRKVALFFETTASNDRCIMQGIIKYASRYGHWIFYSKIHPFYMLRGKNPWHEIIMHELVKWRPDGIIAHVGPRKAEELIALKVPIIIVPIGTEKPEHCATMQGATEPIAIMGANYLLNLGFKNIAFCGFPKISWSNELSKSFIARIVKAGLKTHVYSPPKVSANTFVKEDYKFLCDWLLSLPKPVGVMACNDARGQQVLGAIYAAGLKVPDEVAVLGVDNDNLICDVSNPPLSSIRLALDKAAYRASKLLDSMMSGEKLKEQHLFWYPEQVIIRQSTNILAIEDEEVAKAVRFIQKNVRLSLSVNQVVENTTLSRRTLEQRFKIITNRTIREEIRRICVERISQLLLGTNMTIYQIATALVCPNGEHLSRTFRREKGMSPKEYRRKYGY
jgi:LacI family transcriptional regulator